jgi:two-component system nitrate/nitrite response regulator NarL
VPDEVSPDGIMRISDAHDASVSSTASGAGGEPPDVCPPSVLLCAAVRIYRDGLAAALDRDPRVGAVHVVSETRACRDVVERKRPDVVVIDACAPTAVEVARHLRGSGTGVVALGIADSQADVVALAEVGVSAYLTQEQTIDELIAAVVAVSLGGVGCAPRVTAMLLHHVASLADDRSAPGSRSVRLTRREHETLELMRAGLTNKQIAQRLSIELATVKNHVHHILEKLQARSRAEAVAMTRGARSAVTISTAAGP